MKSLSYKLALEIGGDGWCMAWVIDLPGCFINRPSARQAIADAPEEIEQYLHWLQGHGEDVEIPKHLLVEAALTVERRGTAAGGMTSAYFAGDAQLLGEDELAVLLGRLGFSRQDLLKLLETLPEPAWTWKPERREDLVSAYYPTVREQAQHIAAVERWYIKKLWPVPRFRLAQTPIERLERVRQFVMETLEERAVRDSRKIVKVNHESWTARKVLRRLLYHEPYHVRQIEQILAQYAARSRSG